MYVDESGDPGLIIPGTPLARQPSRHYILTGFIIPASEWRTYLAEIVDIRRYIKKHYGLLMRIELHGSEIVRPPKRSVYRAIGSMRNRIKLYEEILDLVVARMPNATIINVNLNKLHPKYASGLTTKDVQALAWSRLIQRFNTYLQRSCDGDLGMIFADETNELKIRGLLRKMRVFNPVPSHFGGTYPATVDNIVEDPVMRKSHHAYFVQIADMICYSLFRKLYPKGSLRRYNVDKLFDLVGPLCLKAASPRDPQGIVHL
jgi:hypothetical protein